MRLFPLVLLSFTLHGTKSQGYDAVPEIFPDYDLVDDFLERFPLPNGFSSFFCPPSDHKDAASIMVWAFGEENCEITGEGMECRIEEMWNGNPASAKYKQPMKSMTASSPWDNHSGVAFFGIFSCLVNVHDIFWSIYAAKNNIQELDPTAHETFVVKLVEAFGKEYCNVKENSVDCDIPELPNGFAALGVYKRGKNNKELFVEYSSPTVGSSQLNAKNPRIGQFASLLDTIETQRAPFSNEPGNPPGSSTCPASDHEKIVDMLRDAFGEGNCSNRQDGLDCDFELPNFTASAQYNAPLVSLTVEGLDNFLKPTVQYSDFSNPAECSEYFDSILFADLLGVKSQRVLDGCQDTKSSFTYKNNKGKEKTTTCKALAEGKKQKLKIACKKFSGVAEACPGLCKNKKKQCQCVDMDYYYRLNRSGSKRFACTQFSPLPMEERKQRCKKKRFGKMCPGHCHAFINRACPVKSPFFVLIGRDTDDNSPSDELQIFGLQENLVI